MTRGKLVERVEPDSIAEEIGIADGDYVIAVNGIEPADILDWQLAESGEELLLTIQHQGGELVEYEIEKDYDEALGIVFDSPTLDQLHICQNRCLFCFVDQMPARMRQTLYIKDDDYRLSFLSGSYISLTNLRKEDFERIISLHLSPLYVSVHATDPELRQRLMNHRRAGELLAALQHLAAAGIQFHTQVVLCPGLNDGEALEQTIADLYALYPAVQTLAVVPVGLTRHRQGLYPLETSDKAHARQVLDQLQAWQERSLAAHGTRFVFASDEFYTMAGMMPPAAEAYEGYRQLENGVGMVRLFLDDWADQEKNLPAKLAHATEATIATGVSAAVYLAPLVERLNQIENLQLTLLAVENHFFGGEVTVAGLLTFHDLNKVINKVKGRLYLPSVMFKEGRELFLDGYTTEELAAAAKTEVKVVQDVHDFLTMLLGNEMR
ncbi:MAG TPA: DUF512 domain-containing protein [Oscillospiraceae bacterium]|nr:DUF512 domain-containing protein [Oscillospiraceae bacterium]